MPRVLGTLGGMLFLRPLIEAALAPIVPSFGWAQVGAFALGPVAGYWGGAELQALFRWLRRGRAEPAPVPTPAAAPTDPRIASSSLGLAIALTIATFFIGLLWLSWWGGGQRSVSDWVGLIFATLFGGLFGLAAFGAWADCVVYGRSYLTLAPRSDATAKELAGVIEMRLRNPAPTQEFTVRVRRDTDKSPLELRVGADVWRQRGTTVEVPFRFELPADHRLGESIRITVRAVTGRITYNATFRFPARGAARAETTAPVVTAAAPIVTAPPPAVSKPPSAPRPVGPGVGTIFVGLIVSLVMLSALAGPLLGAGFGVYMIRHWARAGREDLRQIGKPAVTTGRVCRFERRGGRSKDLTVRTAYLLEVDGREVVCPAETGGTIDGKDLSECPCADRATALAQALKVTRCDEHVDVLYDPRAPTDCRPVAMIGRRSDSEGDSLPFFLLWTGGCLFVFWRILTRFLPRRRPRAGAALSHSG